MGVDQFFAPFTASRQPTGSQSFTTLAPAYEERLIILAQGKQFQNSNINDYAIPDYLQSRLPKLVVADDRNMTLTDDVQHVNFTIQRVTTKADFISALKTGGAHVVYCGHARHGQGPCFGDATIPSEEWGVHSNSDDTGIFPIGFPYIGMPINEICDEHKYTVTPANANDEKPDAADCHPHAREHLSTMQAFTIDDLSSKCVASNTEVATLLNNANQTDTFWGWDGIGDSGHMERHVLCHCDWQNTDVTPNDLGGVDPTCKAFIFIACSTFVHQYPVVRNLKGWKKDGDDKYAYWTTRVTYSAVMTARWLFRILTYPRRNDFQPWGPSLEWAKNMANSDYAGLSDMPSRLI